MIVVDTNFVHDGRSYTTTAQVEVREHVRCGFDNRYRIVNVKVTTAGGFTSEPTPGGGLYDAAVQAIRKAWRAREAGAS